MNILQFLAVAYLAIGGLYALVVLLFGQDLWYWFPFNVLLGPINLVFLIFFTWSGKDLAHSQSTNKSLLENKKAVVFDLDGTIIETEEAWYKALLKVIATADSTLEPTMLALTSNGSDLKDRWNIIFNYYPELVNKIGSIENAVKQTKENYLSIFSPAGIKPREGFWNMINELKSTYKVKLGLTTNTDREVVNTVLTQLNIADVFDVTICGNEVTKPKPNKEMYIKIAEKLRVKPNQVLVFEDSPVGITAALDSGAVVAIMNTNTVNEDYPVEKVFGPFAEFNTPAKILGKSYKQYREDTIDKGMPLLVEKIKGLYATSTATKSTN